MQSMQNLTRRLTHYNANTLPGRKTMVAAAVCILMTVVEGKIQVLMIQRSVRKGDPWSGNMAFPGGLAQSGDVSLVHTAKRELLEEAGVDIDQCGSYVGRLTDRLTKAHNRWKPMVVVPYVFKVEHLQDLTLDPKEAVDWIWIPLDFLVDPVNREKMRWRRGRFNITLPCYWYEGKRVWGLSLRMLDELLGIYQESHPKTKSQWKLRSRF